MGLAIITSPVEVWKFGTQERAARGTPLTLGLYIESAVGNVFSTLRRSGVTAGYQVTAGRTLLLTRALFRGSVAGVSFGVGYSDADLGLSAAADGANPVNLGLHGSMSRSVLALQTVGVLYDVNIYYEVPAGKFPRCVLEAAFGIVWGEFFGVEI